jgi:RNA polymerase sigma-70 factor (ECF subfamily)
MLSSLALERAQVGEGEREDARSRPAGRVAALYDEHFDFVWRSVRRLGVGGPSVEDVVQEVFVVVHRRLAEFEARSSVRTWLFGIVLGVVRNHRRGERRRDAALSSTPLAEGGAAAEGEAHASLEAREARRILYALLDELGDPLREIFVLAELEQLSAPEIAEALGVNVNTVYSRLGAARTKFKEAAARHRARDGWRLR